MKKKDKEGLLADADWAIDNEDYGAVIVARLVRGKLHLNMNSGLPDWALACVMEEIFRADPNLSRIIINIRGRQIKKK